MGRPHRATDDHTTAIILRERGVRSGASKRLGAEHEFEIAALIDALLVVPSRQKHP